MIRLHADRKQIHYNYGQCCFQFILSVFKTRHRHLRRHLLIVAGLLSVIFIFNITQQWNKLTTTSRTSDSMSKLCFQWILTKDDSVGSHLDLKDTRGRGYFADFRVGLLRERDMEYRGQNKVQQHLFIQPSAGASDQKSMWTNENRFPIRNSPSFKAFLKQYWLKNRRQSDMRILEQLTSTTLPKELMLSTSNPGIPLEYSREQLAGVILAVLVISQPCNVLLRQAARQTWCQGAQEMGVKVGFVVGRMKNWDEIVEREMQLHNDVIIVDQEDSYEYLPNKVLYGLSWLQQQSTTPRYIMKIDDDTIVNLPYLLQELQSGVINSTQIMGAICFNSTVIRNQGDKWAVSLLDFPFSYYPPYAFGGGYVMSASAAETIVKIRSGTSDFLHLEDVYITGILAMKLNITHVTHHAFSYWMTGKASACDFVQEKRITSVNHTEKEFYRLYSDIQVLLRTKDMTKCRKKP